MSESSGRARPHDALNALLEMAEALVSLPPTPPHAADTTITEDDEEDNESPHGAGAVAAPTAAGWERGAANEPNKPNKPNKPLARLAWLIRSVLGLQRVAVLLTQPTSGAITPAAIVGLAPADERRWRDWLASATLSDLLPDAALRERLQADEPLALDMRRADLCPIANALAPFGARQVMIAPMRIGPHMIGLLLLGADDDANAANAANGDTSTAASDNARDQADAAETPAGVTAGVGAFPQEELALVGGVARMAALVIERERLIHERAEERARRIALSDANERMDEFLAIASHELKSPLTAIKANVQLASRRIRRMPAPGGKTTASAPIPTAPTADATADAAVTTQTPDDPRAMALELLQRTEQQISRLNRLVDDLLDTSRIQAGKLELRRAPCDLAQLARDVVEEQRQSQPTRTITLAAPEQPVMIRTDADRVRQVITNYVTNALKYSPADHPVAVALSVARRRARLAVSDQGPGLPPDEQSRIWERFHRAPGVEDLGGAGIGLGLGLHISRTLIERLGGHVGVESAVGEGSTFWCTLPLARQ